MIPIREYYELLVQHLKPLRARVLWLAVLVFVTTALLLVNPQIVRQFIDSAIDGEAVNNLVPLALLYMGIAVVINGLFVVMTYLSEDVGWTATNQLRTDLARHVLALDMTFHKTHTPGELIERIDGDVTALSNFFSAFVMKVVANALVVLGILVLLWFENIWIGLAVTVFVVAALATMLKLESIALPWWKDVRATSAKFYGFVGEQLGGTEDTRANGGVPYMMHRQTMIFREWLPQRIKGFMGFGLMWSTGVGTYAISVALVYWLGSYFFGTGTLSIGSVYLVFFYTEMTRQPMEQIRKQMEDFQKANAGIARVRELLDTTTEMPPAGTAVLTDGPLSVDLEDVGFSYTDTTDQGDSEKVLRDVSFSIRPGRVLGVLGRSGSGKTTLARLLTRLYDPQSGTVSVGGVALPDIDPDSLRRRIGMVSQDVQLFNATIRDNITFYGDTTDDASIMRVIQGLELGDWLASLDDGLDTELESAGGGLSAGQGQLLAFARIFIRDPGLIILDEASSRLDPTTEALIERAIDHLLEERTGVIIAHRLATITRADDILILEDGEVIEFGERTALMADPDSRLSHLLRTGIEEVLA